MHTPCSDANAAALPAASVSSYGPASGLPLRCCQLLQLENDLRALSSEARRSDSLATQISGWLSHTDFAQIKDAAERGALKLRSLASERRGLEGVRASKVQCECRRCSTGGCMEGEEEARAAPLGKCELHGQGGAAARGGMGSGRRGARFSTESACGHMQPTALPPTPPAPAPLQEILHPFLLVCESRNPRLVGLALASIQKLLANDAVSAEGRAHILGALNQVRGPGACLRHAVCAG